MSERMIPFSLVARCGHQVHISIAESVDSKISTSIQDVVANSDCYFCQQSDVRQYHLTAAIKTLSDAMQADQELAWTWHCNISMPIHDCGVNIEIANDAAERVMQQLFCVDTSQLRKERRASA